MKELMSSNIYEGSGVVAVVGACLSAMQPEAFALVEAQADMLFSLCLEQTHINMAITKLGAVLSTGQVKRLLLVSVDHSPHCVQMHYIKQELERMLPAPYVEDYIAADGSLLRVPEEAIALSKSLGALTALCAAKTPTAAE